METNTKLVLWTAVLIVGSILVLWLAPFTVVSPGERVIVLRLGKIDRVLDTGLHWVTPIIESTHSMNVQVRKLEIEKSEAYSHDLQVVDIHSAVNYSLDPQSVGQVYQEIGDNYETKVLSQRLEAAVKQTVAKYSAEELLNKRGEVQSAIEEAFKSSLPPFFLSVKYALVNEAFSQAYETAIEAKQVAQQDAERAKNELTKAQIDADARIAQVKGEAEAIRIQASAINSQGGADYVQLQAIKAWKGDVPTYMMSGATVPFISLGK